MCSFQASLIRSTFQEDVMFTLPIRWPQRRALTVGWILTFSLLAGTLVGCGGQKSSYPTAMKAVQGESPMNAPASYDHLQQEQYAHIVENPFIAVASEPMSTFSADVNTASYANMRRHLQTNKTLPPKDAVRIAEFINYFHYDYPNPTDVPTRFHSRSISRRAPGSRGIIWLGLA